MIDWETSYRELEEQMRIMLLQVANRYEELELVANDAHILSVRNIYTSKSKNVIEAIAQASGTDVEFAFALYGPDGFRQVLPYARKNSASFTPNKEGKFRVWVHVREVAMRDKVVVKKSSEIQMAGMKND